MQKKYSSWANYPKTTQNVIQIGSRFDGLPETDNQFGMLPYGQGRSYGDVCLNDQGILLDSQLLDHFISFDTDKGILCCESGVTFEQILSLTTKQGWFLPVTPGTKYITVGGAIANDVHGKNHHGSGTFGCHVISFELLKSDGKYYRCSQDENTELFHATIGGLGLTGLITWAEFSLKKIPGEYVLQESIRFKNLAEFFKLSESSDKDWEYTVAWIDCLASGKNTGRGIFMRANHCESNNKKSSPHFYSVPCNAPGFTLNTYTVKALNSVYYNRPIKNEAVIHYDPFFYPLDKILHWNRLYGKSGFLQYQCVIPPELAEQAMHEILNKISASGQGSFLSVLKQFGNNVSPGLLTFPRPGTTLALDFPIKGDKTFSLLEQLDEITLKYQGSVYPAKDARISAEAFKNYFPDYDKFKLFIDPHFSSSFWRRVNRD